MVIHVVKEGDSILSVANEYGISPERLTADNGLYGLNRLVTGQALLILTPSQTYTVQEGDTIYSISQSFGISPERLKQKNPSLAQTNTIVPGEVLTITFEGEGNSPIEIYGFMYPNIKDNILNQSLPLLWGGAIFSYGVRSDGSLIPTDDSEHINKMLQSRVNPFMVLSSIDETGSFSSGNAAELFNNEAMQNTAINNIINTMRQKGYRGLDIDFEFVNPEDSEAFADFVENATDRLNQNGFMVNTDLAPKTSDTQRGTLYEGHNYEDIGEASNTVMVMTYEWGYTYSEPMAVAPIDKVREVLEYAVSRIPRNKIYMGMPNYGYDWKLPYEKGVTRARLIGNDEAISIAAENNAEILFDERSQTPYFTYRSADGTNHEVWFEDIRSMRAKFDLLSELGLRGAGFWNLMRSFNQNWSYIAYRYNPRKMN